jgi:endoglucanase
MKRNNLIGAIALAFVFCLLLTGCEKPDDPGGTQGGPSGNGGNSGGTPASWPENTAITADESAAGFVAKIRIGWNLGNTLDAPNETSWGNPRTTKAMITAIKDAGFNAIRIPVSWNGHAPKPNYTINSAWMSRVKEIVDYAMENNLYIILNTHHDEEIFKFMDKDMVESKKAFKAIWEQIAAAFRDYNYNLIFEGLNEPRTKGSLAEWNGGTAEERNNLNAMHQLFVDTVRASGGNNGKRILMVSTYAASVESAAVNGLTLPNDPSNTVKKLIVSTHSYSPYNFALNENSTVKTWSKNNSSDTSPITDWITRVNTAFISKGIPVIAGEFGALNKDNEAVRADWAEYYVSEAKKKGIPCFIWDDGGNFKLLNRSSRTFYYPLILAALMRGTQ